MVPRSQLNYAGKPCQKQVNLERRNMRRVYHRIEQIAGNVINVIAEGVSYKELAEVKSRRGTSLAQVIRLQGKMISLQVFAGARGISTNAEVCFLGHPMTTAFSDSLLGRSFTGTGQPRDNGHRRRPFADEPAAGPRPV